jgi:hypothetical protein
MVCSFICVGASWSCVTYDMCSDVCVRVVLQYVVATVILAALHAAVRITRRVCSTGVAARKTQQQHGMPAAVVAVQGVHCGRSGQILAAAYLFCRVFRTVDASRAVYIPGSSARLRVSHPCAPAAAGDGVCRTAPLC